MDELIRAPRSARIGAYVFDEDVPPASLRSDLLALMFDRTPLASPASSVRRWVVASVLVVLGVGLLPLDAAAQKRLVIHGKSQFWIQGEATTHDFTCAVDRVEGHATLPPARDSIPETATREQQTEVVVTVPVQAFDCGNDRMTRDLQETLEMEAHPDIQFELIHATVGAAVDTTLRWRRVKILGALTVAGTKRVTSLRAVGRALDAHRFRVRGCHPIRMTHFNIEPPTKAFGLIKVKNRVEVQFDLLAHTRSMDGEAPFGHLAVDESPSCAE
jgi:hypothetical protein